MASSAEMPTLSPRTTSAPVPAQRHTPKSDNPASVRFTTPALSKHGSDAKRDFESEAKICSSSNPKSNSGYCRKADTKFSTFSSQDKEFKLDVAKSHHILDASPCNGLAQRVSRVEDRLESSKKREFIFDSVNSIPKSHLVHHCGSNTKGGLYSSYTQRNRADSSPVYSARHTLTSEQTFSFNSSSQNKEFKLLKPGHVFCRSSAHEIHSAGAGQTSDSFPKETETPFQKFKSNKNNVLGLSNNLGVGSVSNFDAGSYNTFHTRSSPDKVIRHTIDLDLIENMEQSNLAVPEKYMSTRDDSFSTIKFKKCTNDVGILEQSCYELKELLYEGSVPGVTRKKRWHSEQSSKALNTHVPQLYAHEELSYRSKMKYGGNNSKRPETMDHIPLSNIHKTNSKVDDNESSNKSLYTFQNQPFLQHTRACYHKVFEPTGHNEGQFYENSRNNSSKNNEHGAGLLKTSKASNKSTKGTGQKDVKSKKQPKHEQNLLDAERKSDQELSSYKTLNQDSRTEEKGNKPSGAKTKSELNEALDGEPSVKNETFTSIESEVDKFSINKQRRKSSTSSVPSQTKINSKTLATGETNMEIGVLKGEEDQQESTSVLNMESVSILKKLNSIEAKLHEIRYACVKEKATDSKLRKSGNSSSDVKVNEGQKYKTLSPRSKKGTYSKRQISNFPKDDLLENGQKKAGTLNSQKMSKGSKTPRGKHHNVRSYQNKKIRAGELDAGCPCKTEIKNELNERKSWRKAGKSGNRRTILQTVIDSSQDFLNFVGKSLKPFDLLARPKNYAEDSGNIPSGQMSLLSQRSNISSESDTSTSDEEDKGGSYAKGKLCSTADKKKPKKCLGRRENKDSWFSTATSRPGCDPLCQPEYEVLVMSTCESLCLSPIKYSTNFPCPPEAKPMKDSPYDYSCSGDKSTSPRRHIRTGNFKDSKFSSAPQSQINCSAFSKYRPVANYPPLAERPISKDLDLPKKETILIRQQSSFGNEPLSGSHSRFAQERSYRKEDKDSSHQGNSSPVVSPQSRYADAHKGSPSKDGHQPSLQSGVMEKRESLRKRLRYTEEAEALIRNRKLNKSERSSSPERQYRAAQSLAPSSECSFERSYDFKFRPCFSPYLYLDGGNICIGNECYPKAFESSAKWYEPTENRVCSSNIQPEIYQCPQVASPNRGAQTPRSDAAIQSRTGYNGLSSENSHPDKVDRSPRQPESAAHTKSEGSSPDAKKLQSSNSVPHNETSRKGSKYDVPFQKENGDGKDVDSPLPDKSNDVNEELDPINSIASKDENLILDSKTSLSNHGSLSSHPPVTDDVAAEKADISQSMVDPISSEQHDTQFESIKSVQSQETKPSAPKQSVDKTGLKSDRPVSKESQGDKPKSHKSQRKTGQPEKQKSEKSKPKPNGKNKTTSNTKSGHDISQNRSYSSEQAPDRNTQETKQFSLPTSGRALQNIDRMSIILAPEPFHQSNKRKARACERENSFTTYCFQLPRDQSLNNSKNPAGAKISKNDKGKAEISKRDGSKDSGKGGSKPTVGEKGKGKGPKKSDPGNAEGSGLEQEDKKSIKDKSKAESSKRDGSKDSGKGGSKPTVDEKVKEKGPKKSDPGNAEGSGLEQDSEEAKKSRKHDSKKTKNSNENLQELSDPMGTPSLETNPDQTLYKTLESESQPPDNSYDLTPETFEERIGNPSKPLLKPSSHKSLKASPDQTPYKTLESESPPYDNSYGLTSEASKERIENPSKPLLKPSSHKSLKASPDQTPYKTLESESQPPDNSYGLIPEASKERIENPSKPLLKPSSHKSLKASPDQTPYKTLESESQPPDNSYGLIPEASKERIENPSKPLLKPSSHKSLKSHEISKSQSDKLSKSQSDKLSKSQSDKLSTSQSDKLSKSQSGIKVEPDWESIERRDEKNRTRDDTRDMRNDDVPHSEESSINADKQEEKADARRETAKSHEERYRRDCKTERSRTGRPGVPSPEGTDQGMRKRKTCDTACASEKRELPRECKTIKDPHNSRSFTSSKTAFNDACSLEKRQPFRKAAICSDAEKFQRSCELYQSYAKCFSVCDQQPDPFYKCNREVDNTRDICSAGQKHTRAPGDYCPIKRNESDFKCHLETGRPSQKTKTKVRSGKPTHSRTREFYQSDPKYRPADGDGPFAKHDDFCGDVDKAFPINETSYRRPNNTQSRDFYQYDSKYRPVKRSNGSGSFNTRRFDADNELRGENEGGPDGQKRPQTREFYQMGRKYNYPKNESTPDPCCKSDIENSKPFRRTRPRSAGRTPTPKRAFYESSPRDYPAENLHYDSSPNDYFQNYGISCRDRSAPAYRRRQRTSPVREFYESDPKKCYDAEAEAEPPRSYGYKRSTTSSRICSPTCFRRAAGQLSSPGYNRTPSYHRAGLRSRRAPPPYCSPSQPPRWERSRVQCWDSEEINSEQASPCQYLTFIDRFCYDDDDYVQTGEFQNLVNEYQYEPSPRRVPSKQKRPQRGDDMAKSGSQCSEERLNPPGVVIFQIAARYATFGGIRVAGGVRVLMDAPDKMGYVQIISPLGQAFITHYVNTLNFLHSSSAAGVAWSAVVWDPPKDGESNNNKGGRGRQDADTEIPGKVDSSQVVFCEPYQAHRFRAVLETIKAAFSGGDGALATPNVPPLPPAGCFNPCDPCNPCIPCPDPCNPCNPCNPCIPCPDPCNPCNPPPGFPNPCADPCCDPPPPSSSPCPAPFPPPRPDLCGFGCLPSCLPCPPKPSNPCVCPPPWCSSVGGPSVAGNPCCPPTCATPCPMPCPTSGLGQCPPCTPNPCPDDCDPYAYTNAYGKTLFCQVACLVKLGRDEVWQEMHRGPLMIIQEPNCMGYSLVLVNDRQIVLSIQKLSRKTDFKPSPHTQYGFLYNAVTTTEKGSLHENFLVSFQCKQHAEQFRLVAMGCKRVMMMSACNYDMSNSNKRCTPSCGLSGGGGGSYGTLGNTGGGCGSCGSEFGPHRRRPGHRSAWRVGGKDRSPCRALGKEGKSDCPTDSARGTRDKALSPCGRGERHGLGNTGDLKGGEERERYSPRPGGSKYNESRAGIERGQNEEVGNAMKSHEAIDSLRREERRDQRQKSALHGKHHRDGGLEGGRSQFNGLGEDKGGSAPPSETQFASSQETNMKELEGRMQALDH